MPIVRGLAVQLADGEPGRCAVTEIATDTDLLTGITYGPDGDALEVLSRAVRVVARCGHPGTRPYLNAVLCDAHHAQLTTRAPGEGGEALN